MVAIQEAPFVSLENISELLANVLVPFVTGTQAHLGFHTGAFAGCLLFLHPESSIIFNTRIIRWRSKLFINHEHYSFQPTWERTRDFQGLGLGPCFETLQKSPTRQFSPPDKQLLHLGRAQLALWSI